MAKQTPEQDPIPVEIVVTEPIPPNRPRKVYAGMWGVPEIGAVAAGALAILAAMTVYFFFVIPSNRELARNRSEADRLEAELMSASSKYGEITSSEAQVDKIVASMDDFETRFLPAVSNGQAALYQRLNGLFIAYGLVNTTGPDYNPLEAADQATSNQQSDDEKGRAKFRSIYPGVYVSMTLEGPYSNLRRFIREIETGNEFIIISAVELAPSENEAQKKPEQVQNAAAPGAPPIGPPQNPNNVRGGMPSGFDPRFQSQPQQQVRKPQGKMHGEVVSLRIEMAAYFRRPNFAPLTIGPGQE